MTAPTSEMSSSNTAKRPLRKLTQRAALMLFGFAIALILAEVGLRIVGFSNPVKTVPDDHCGYIMTPQGRWIHTSEGHADIRINRFGFRDKQWSLEKPDDVFRIAVVGDSFVAALEVNEKDRFPQIIEDRLSKDAVNGKTLEVMNFGQPGYGTAQELMMLRHKVWQFDPDVVILAIFTANDIRNNSRELQTTTQSPYFLLKGEEVVLDEGLEQYREPLYKRLIRGAAPYCRLAQLAYQISQAYRARTAEAKRKRATGQLAELYALGFTYPESETAIYADPVESKWQEAWRITEGIIAEISQDAVANQATLLLVTLSNDIQAHPDPKIRQKFLQLIGADDVFYPDKRFTLIGKQFGIPVLNLAPLMQSHAEEKGRYH